MGPRVRGDDEKKAVSIFILHCGKKIAHSELPGNF
jgi:hypothetical protein